MGCGLCQPKYCQLVEPIALEDSQLSHTEPASVPKCEAEVYSNDRPKLFTVNEEASSLEESVRTFRRLESKIRESAHSNCVG